MPERDDRALARAAAAACAVALLALFWPVAARRLFYYSDLGHFSLPIRLFLAENLERGITPLWMPNLFCGFYVHGEGNIGIFHPLRWLLYRFLPVTEAFNLECLIPYPFALAGMALFLRRLALPASAAIFGGLTFAFSAYLTLRLAHLNALAVLAHLGWLLLAIDVLLRDEGRSPVRAWLGLALLTGSQWLVGYPVAIAYGWLIAIPYALYAAVQSRSEPEASQDKPIRARIGALWTVASGLAVGTILGAIQVLPTWEHFTSSSRAAPSYEFLTQFSMHPMNLVSALSPWLFRHHIYTEQWYDPVEQAFYFGPVVPIAALWVALRWQRLGPWRPLLMGLFALAAVALILVLGKYTPAYRYFITLPLAGLLRVPARYSIALYFAGAVTAAVAFADLLRGDPEIRRRSAWIWLLPALSWLVAGAALALRGPSWSWITDQLNPPRWIALGPLALTAAAALWTAAVRGHRAALFGLVALALADGAGYAASTWWIDPPQTLAAYRASIAQPPAPPPQRVTTPWYFDISWTEGDRVLYWSATRLIVHGARLVSGYAAVTPATRLDYSKHASLRVAGAAAVFTGPRTVVLPGALPRARMVASAVRSANPGADVEAIDVATTALVDEDVTLVAGPPGTAGIEEEVPGAIRIAVDAPTRQLLLLAESYHAGWRVAIDGREARVLRANGDFMGVVLDAGAHRVEFRFAPRSFAIGREISVAGIGVVLAIALYGRRGARSAIAATNPP